MLYLEQIHDFCTQDVMLVVFCVQFEANQFAVGTYIFRVVGLRPFMTAEQERVVTVEF